MLTSMIKRVDVAVYEAFMAGNNGSWSSGMRVLGLAEGGVGWALDEHNRSLVDAEMEKRMQEMHSAIVSGQIAVHDYMSDSTCKY